MKVLRADQIREADQHTITHEPISSIDLMERASRACFDWLSENTNSQQFFIFCGRGNNGGDGLAIARMLLAAGKNVKVYLISGKSESSPDNLINQQRLKNVGCLIHALNSLDDLPNINEHDVILDALFGTGLSGPLSGFARDLVNELNGLAAKKIAVDLPSGLISDEEHLSDDICFLANYTLSFQVPKLCFFLPSCAGALGDWRILDIGLNQDFIDSQESPFYYLQSADLKDTLHERAAFSHKGTFGHSLVIAGSFGKVGAAVLATRAALRSGSGLVTCCVPHCGYEILQTSAPEAMVLSAENENYIDRFPDTTHFSAVGLGPGIGQEEQTKVALLEFLKPIDMPFVLDADALNILSTQNNWLSLLPKNCILTPHPGEFDRLFGSHASTLERIRTQMEFAKKQRCCLILKGRYTSVALPDGRVFFNSSGNPGMATGGSGDVLSGILVGLLAQSYTPEESCLLGVHLHGLAGDLAKNQWGEEALIASDIIEQLGDAFLALNKIN